MGSRRNCLHDCNKLEATSGFFPSLLLSLLLVLISGCATFQPKPFEEARYLNHAVTKSDDDVRVTADVLTQEETLEVFGVDFVGKGIQPIWIEIQNRGKDPYWFVPHRLDPEYYSAMEAANIGYGSRSSEATKRIYEHFYDVRMTRYIPPGETRKGFVFTKPDGRTRAIYFRMGKALGADTSEADNPGKFGAMREADLNFIRIGNECYEIPEAVVLGG